MKSSPLRAGVASSRAAARPVATARRAYADEVVDWLNDASLRLLEARLARARRRAEAQAEQSAMAAD